MASFDLYTIFSIAFLASFGHCAGMCGGIVLAYSSVKISPDSPIFSAIYSHLLYSLGRVSSYALLGAFFGALGAVVAITPLARAWLFILIGISMALLGIALAFFPKILANFELSANFSPHFAQIFRTLLSSQTRASFYFLGILNGFLPCGLVYFFALSAASSASVFYGALSMGVFGLATIPALFSLALITGIAQKSALRGVFMKISALLIFLFGIYTLLKGCYLLNDPSGANTPKFFGCTLC